MKKEDSDNSSNGPARLPARPAMLLLYNIFLSLYVFAIRLYALVNPKAKKWVDGRKDWRHNIKDKLIPGEKRIWIHCSSLGEFEQAKPLVEALKGQFPSYKIVITFFSPSGFASFRQNEFVDYVFYLPIDSKQNARQFISLIEPSLAMFVKYEFWYYYLAELRQRHIPAVLVSGAFREGQVFSKWYGGLFRDMLRCFTFFFLQDVDSQKVLNRLGFQDNILISGDTRYDRVSVIAQNIKPIPAIDAFKGQNHIFIAGSTWPGDEDVLKDCIATFPSFWKLIIVPHEIGEAHIKKIQQLFGDDTILFSALDAENTGAEKKILIIDNIGMLSRLYSYGDIAFVGGGFQKGGIHNILEPAVFGVPIIFGPIYEKFVEANELISYQLVFPISDAAGCNDILKKLLSDPTYRTDMAQAIKKFMRERTGATKTIVDKVAIEKWLQ